MRDWFRRILQRLSPQGPTPDGIWTVTAYRSGDQMVAPDNRRAANLVIDGDAVSGTMGVNRLTGQIGPSLPMGPLAITRMAGPPELMSQEDILVGHLQEADSIDVAGDGMTLTRNGLTLVQLQRSGPGDTNPAS